ncbi:hypothetical protein NP233_g4200 [Leucocoprinus birnbaumii]|uniref:Uncharacterized protein n=1 Tax=Leucocoprinus birnbaumii TaxID=56174 RepID=A0AAD5VYV1_9AGAR|nr:hypothetical protein NP233_g4200 [Leucocoprinus birnbaumii]
MEDFPWEHIKTETLRQNCRDLGLDKALSKDEAIRFLKAVQRQGLGPVLREEFKKDMGIAGASSPQNASVNGLQATPSKGKSSSTTKPSTPSRRAPSTRNRQAPEVEPMAMDVSFASLDADASSEAEAEEPEATIRETRGRKRKNIKQPSPQPGEEPESISAIASRTRLRDKPVKRVRLSDPGPPPARSTRSHGPAAPVTSISAIPEEKSSALRRRPGRASTKQDGEKAKASASSTSASGRAARSQSKGKAKEPETLERMATRSSKSQVTVEDDEDEDEEKEEEEEEDEGTDADADGEDEVVEDDEVEEDRFTGPGAVAAALTKASATSRPRGRPPKAATSQLRKEDMNARSSGRTKPRPAITNTILSRTRSTAGGGERASTRTIKPTAKGALLNSPKATSILSRPIRPSVKRQFQSQASKNMRQAREQRDREHELEKEKEKKQSEVFEGVVLAPVNERMYIIEPSDGGANGVVLNGVGGGGGEGGGDLAVQLDEFVANGLAGQGQDGDGDGMDIDRDPVLEQDELSDLGGSNKENDFSFRNVSESSAEGPPEVGRTLFGVGVGVSGGGGGGDEDAEGEPEPEQPQIQVDVAPQVEPQPAADGNDANTRSPLQAIQQLALLQIDSQPAPVPEPQLEPEPQPQPQLEVQMEMVVQPQPLEPQPEPQTQSQPQPEPEPQPEPQPEPAPMVFLQAFF